MKRIRLDGDASPVYVNVAASLTGCQATTTFGGSCGLPPFATLYRGEHDGERDVEYVLCWRHLLKLGDSGAMIVRPLAG